MNIYPAIDIKSGKCVRLYQGNYDQMTIYGTDILAVAESFAEQGASCLHVVDLDGAQSGQPTNLESILKIANKTKIKIQVGGGIRIKEQIIKLLDLGIDKVVLGSLAISNPSLVNEWILEFGAERITLALDVHLDKNKIPILALDGWQTRSEKTLWSILDKYKNSRCHVLCTDISRDGTMQGPNFKLYSECVKKYPTLKFQASGGVNTLNDLKQLFKVNVDSVVIGKAFYEKKFTFKEALAEVKVC